MSFRYLPYTSKYKHAGMKIYHPSPTVGRLGITYRTSNHATQLEQINCPINDDEWQQLHLIMDPSDEYLNERKRIFILEDFANIIQQMTIHFTASIWKTIKACPLLTIRELLWLKVDDVDRRVDHVENMLIQWMEEVTSSNSSQFKYLAEASAKNTILEQEIISLRKEVNEAQVILRKDLSAKNTTLEQEIISLRKDLSAKNTTLEQEIIILRKGFDDAKRADLRCMSFRSIWRR